MDRFSKLHPLLHIVYFLMMFVFVLSINNPFFSAISLLSALLYGVKIRGKNILASLKLVVVMLFVVSAFNMLFAHYGEDALFTIRDTRFTAEALFYGFNQGMVLGSVMLWFGAFSRVMDSERVCYLLRFSPRIALLFSMILGFIPRFTKKLEDIRDAKLGLNGGKPPKNKIRDALDNLSSLVSYSLEASIITADSMTARGYNPRAVRAGRYKISASDISLLVLSIALCVLIIVEKARGNLLFIFDPFISSEAFSVIAFASFCVLSLLPLFIDLWEDLLWTLSRSRA